MSRLTFCACLLLASSAASANTFWIEPSPTEVARATHSAELTLWYLPSHGADAAEVDVALALDDFTFVEVTPGASAGTRRLYCTLGGGTARAVAFDTAANAFPAVPMALCRVRVRPHDDTPAGDYLLRPQNAIVGADGVTSLPVQTSDGTLRVVP